MATVLHRDSFFLDDGTRSAELNRPTWFRTFGTPTQKRFENLFASTGFLLDDVISDTRPGFGLTAAKADITARTATKQATIGTQSQTYPILAGPHNLPIVQRSESLKTPDVDFDFEITVDTATDSNATIYKGRLSQSAWDYIESQAGTPGPQGPQGDPGVASATSPLQLNGTDIRITPLLGLISDLGKMIFWSGSAWSMSGGSASNGKVLRWNSGTPEWADPAVVVADGGGGGGLSDTGWVDVTLSLDPEATISDTVRQRRYGNIVFIKGSVFIDNTGTASRFINIGTVEAGNIPVGDNITSPRMAVHLEDSSHGGIGPNVIVYGSSATGGHFPGQLKIDMGSGIAGANYGRINFFVSYIIG